MHSFNRVKPPPPPSSLHPTTTYPPYSLSSLSFQVWYLSTCISSARSAVVVLMFKYIHEYILVLLQIYVYNTQVYINMGTAPAMSFCTLYAVQIFVSYLSAHSSINESFTKDHHSVNSRPSFLDSFSG